MESCEVIAKEDVAATAFSGKLTRNGRLPRIGTLTRIVEGLDRRCGVPAVRVAPYGVGFLVALLLGTTALGEGAALEIAGGDTLLTSGPIAPPCSEVTSGFAVTLDSIVLASESSFLARVDSLELAGRGVGVCEADSSACLGGVADLASIALVAFDAPSSRLTSEPRPGVSPMVRAATVNKNSNANAVT